MKAHGHENREHSLAIDATLLTANTVDFERIPGLRFENWL